MEDNIVRDGSYQKIMDDAAKCYPDCATKVQLSFYCLLLEKIATYSTDRNKKQTAIIRYRIALSLLEIFTTRIN